MKNNDLLSVSGHLDIYKIYEDGTEEQVFGEENTITSGMGVGLGLLYAGSGATDITNFQIRYFQLGVSGDSRISTNAWGGTYGVSESYLVSALGQGGDGSLGKADYLTTADSTLPVVYHNMMAWDGGLQLTVPGSGGSVSNLWYFGVISDNSIKRVDLNSVTYIIYVDRGACNNHTLNEIGLFMQNPLGETTRRSNLVAYRPFINIAKTSDFALVFKWTLNF